CDPDDALRGCSRVPVVYDRARGVGAALAMAVLAKHPEGPRAMLLSRHVVGRSRIADLRMTDPTVSGEHAVLRWTGREWELHDLGSRNGTSVDGRKLASGERLTIGRGAVIAFGQPENAWRLDDDAAPTIMAISDDEDAPMCARNDLLALPSDDDPEVAIFRDPGGNWLIEQSGETVRVADRTTVRAAGRDYLLRGPDVIAPTWDNSSPAPHLAALTLQFKVSRDEEYVALTARGEHHVIDLGARAHHALLLTLARSRLEDRKARPATERVPALESSEGWVYQ